MIIPALLSLSLLAGSSQPAPLPDASPTVRGAVNASKDQRLTGKVFVDRVLVNADAGFAYASTCAPRVADLGSCNVSALQCVIGSGWFQCPGADGGWGPFLGSGFVQSVGATAPLHSTGGAIPTMSCDAASSSQPGCLSAADWQAFNSKQGALTPVAPIAFVGVNVICLPAGSGDGGCLTNDTQAVFGQKHFEAGIYVVFVDGGVVAVNELDDHAAGVLFKSLTPANNGTVDWDFSTTVTRLSGNPLFRVRNNGVDLFTIDHLGNVIAPNTFNAPQFNGFVWSATGAGGLAAVSKRGDGDIGGDLGITSGRDPLLACPPMLNGSGARGQVWNISSCGEVYAGTQFGRAAFILNAGASGAVFGDCSDFGNGCYLPFVGHLHNDSNHGTINIVDGTSRDAGGGVVLEVEVQGDVCRAANGPVPLGSNTYETAYMTTSGDLFLGGAGVQAYYGNGALPGCQTGNTPFHPFDGGGVGEGWATWYHDLNAPVFCDPFHDDGGFRVVAHRAAQYMPSILVNTTMAVGTIGGFKLPDTEVVSWRGLQAYVGTPGAGGSTSATFQVTDGSHVCLFSMPCNHAAGPVYLNTFGSDCQSAFTPGAMVTWSITSLGACAGSPPVITGNVTPEVQLL